jgi:hypothetical protein
MKHVTAAPDTDIVTSAATDVSAGIFRFLTDTDTDPEDDLGPAFGRTRHGRGSGTGLIRGLRCRCRAHAGVTGRAADRGGFGNAA